jgi:hypothetical protein
VNELTPNQITRPLFDRMLYTYKELGASDFVEVVKNMVSDVLRQMESRQSPVEPDFQPAGLKRVLADERAHVLADYEDVQVCERYLDVLDSDQKDRYFVNESEGSQISELTIYCDRRMFTIGRTSLDSDSISRERVNSPYWLTLEIPQDIVLPALERKLKGQWSIFLETIYDGTEVVSGLASLSDEAILALRVIQKAILLDESIVEGISW